ncbi:MAG: hypothetical protein WCV82_00585 [Candidatus Paceibacterota bacterium]
MKNDLKFKKTTRISWNSWNDGTPDRDAFPVPLTLSKIPLAARGSFLGFDIRSSVYLHGATVEAISGKLGKINIVIAAHHNDRPLGAGDLVSIAKGLATLNSDILEYRGFPLNNQGPFLFDLRVPNGAGFCETAVEHVSKIVTFLGVTGDRWFRHAIKIKQSTLVLVKGNWIEYEDYLVGKFPIRLPNCAGEPILREGGIEA